MMYRKGLDYRLVDIWQHALRRDSALGWRECYLVLDGMYLGLFHVGVTGEPLNDLVLLAKIAERRAEDEARHAMLQAHATAAQDLEDLLP